MRSAGREPGEGCRVCGGALRPERLEFGEQPICNRYLRHPAEAEYTHPLAMGVCSECGAVQLVAPVPAHEVAPRYGWIRYNEPEGHLDRVANALCASVKARRACSALGISAKDDSTLSRLRDRGVEDCRRLGGEDLSCPAPDPGVESVQDRLTRGRADSIAGRLGRADLVVARHILEHSHDVGGFLEALKALLKPEGLVAIEVPDSAGALASADYSAVWEEHLLYFTPGTFRDCLHRHGLEVLRIESYPYVLENSLVAIARPGRRVPPTGAPDGAEEEVDRALEFFAGYSSARQEYGRSLSSLRRDAGPVALLGAGHLVCSFVNLLGLAEHFECVVDDDANRQGLYMPGSRLPILPSAALGERGIRTCLLGVNPLNEEAAMARHREFAARGGAFRSIFPASSHAAGVRP